MGVALARMFLYNEASYSFMKAYEIGQHKNSYKCYLAAKWFMDKDGSVINEDVPEEEYIIRRKIEHNPAQPQYIFTEVGVGYRIVDPA